jgi:hypothetical protein
MLNMFRKIEAFLKDLGSAEYRDTKITLAENGFDLAMSLGSCLPIGASEDLSKLCDEIQAEMKENGYEVDGPFRLQTDDDGGILMCVEFYNAIVEG